LDIGTTQFVRQEILNIKNDGAAVLLVSSDLSEIMSLSDEIAVIYKGKIMGVVKIHETSREQIGAMMGGISIEKEERVK
jgi:simple sugar transport system ATP-binding protein